MLSRNSSLTEAWQGTHSRFVRYYDLCIWRQARRQCKLKTDVIVNHGVDTELRRVAESDPP